MSDILDSYCEKAAFGKRVIELYDDRVVVAGHRILGGGDFKLVIPLVTLDPTISQLGIHQQTRLIGTAVLLCAGIGALSWAVHPPMYAHIGFWVCSLLAVFGFVLLVQSFRRIETAAFYSTAGVLGLVLHASAQTPGAIRISSSASVLRSLSADRQSDAPYESLHVV